MTIITNNLSYNQERAERLIANSLLTSESRLKFETAYGCGDFIGNFSPQTVDIERLKEKLFSEYDGLWKALANS